MDSWHTQDSLLSGVGPQDCPKVRVEWTPKSQYKNPCALRGDHWEPGDPVAPPLGVTRNKWGIAFDKGTVHTDRRQSYPDSHIHFGCGLLGRTYNVAAKLGDEDARVRVEVGGG